MIELRHDKLVFSFPEVHPSATMTINFQRTLRIPDDDSDYPLPPGMGRFPLRHVDDFADKLPSSWKEHGGIMLPMYQAEAMWLHFDGKYDREREVKYPFAVKIATGKINAVSGQNWKAGLNRSPQDYVVLPKQPWLDGYCVEKGVIRQFVAMPLGEGYTAEEQITGKAEFGGLQIMAFPMKRKTFEKRFPIKEDKPRFMAADCGPRACCYVSESEMGLAPGGRMKQEIYEDPYRLDDWNLEHTSRCFVHICNSETWTGITGQLPPTRPFTAADYTKAGLPWFAYYDAEAKALEGAKKLGKLKSVKTLGDAKREQPLPENESVQVKKNQTINLRPANTVREWEE